MWSNASSSPMVAKGQLALRKIPLKALQIAEQILNTDPQKTFQRAHRIIVVPPQLWKCLAPRSCPRNPRRNLPKIAKVAIKFANSLGRYGAT